MKNSYSFYSLSPSYKGENKDTYKGVPCKISIDKKSDKEYLICIDKIISDRLVFYKKSVTNFRIEDEGNLLVIYFEECNDVGSKYILTVNNNGYATGLTYYPDKQNKDILIKYINPIFNWLNWSNFRLFEDIDNFSESELTEINNYCDQIAKYSSDFETVEFFKVMQAYVRHYQKDVYVKELNDSQLINKALEELDSYLVTCIVDLESAHIELVDQMTDGGIISTSEHKKVFINTRKQLNYLLALKSVLNSLLFDIKNGFEKENNEIRNKIHTEYKQRDNKTNKFKNETVDQKNEKSNIGFFIIVGLVFLLCLYFLL